MDITGLPFLLNWGQSCRPPNYLSSGCMQLMWGCEEPLIKQHKSQPFGGIPYTFTQTLALNTCSQLNFSSRLLHCSNAFYSWNIARKSAYMARQSRIKFQMHYMHRTGSSVQLPWLLHAHSYPEPQESTSLWVCGPRQHFSKHASLVLVTYVNKWKQCDDESGESKTRKWLECL